MDEDAEEGPIETEQTQEERTTRPQFRPQMCDGLDGLVLNLELLSSSLFREKTQPPAVLRVNAVDCLEDGCTLGNQPAKL